MSQGNILSRRNQGRQSVSSGSKRPTLYTTSEGVVFGKMSDHTLLVGNPDRRGRGVRLFFFGGESNTKKPFCRTLRLTQPDAVALAAVLQQILH